MGVGVVAAGGDVGEAAFKGDFFGVGVALAGLGDAAEDADALAVAVPLVEGVAGDEMGDAVAVLGVHAVGPEVGGFYDVGVGGDYQLFGHGKLSIQL